MNVSKVAIVGAGVSGVCAAIHLKAAGLDVTVFERSARAGGVWVYDERVSQEPAYPSIWPSVGDSPDDPRSKNERGGRQDSPMAEEVNVDDIARHHAPPGPCYAGLMNNVSTSEMELSTIPWKTGTGEFVQHNILGDYIQDAARAGNVETHIRFDTRVANIQKSDSDWIVRTTQLCVTGSRIETVDAVETYDAVVIASGHYHACHIPDLPGLSSWKRSFPDRIQHSKRYREPEKFRGKNVLLVGAGVSSTDIARELGTVGKTVFQVSRGGMYDLPPNLLPDNAIRIGAIASFDPPTAELRSGEPIPATVILESGERLCKIDHVILCTGYHVSFPFMRQYHDDDMFVTEASEAVIATKEGQQTHNLHKDIFYIPDPTLSFVGVPYHVATFSLFEFQTMAIAAVYSGRAKLPTQAEMRAEYKDRLIKKGAGRTFHSLKKEGDEIAYVDDLLAIINSDLSGRQRVLGHSAKWHVAYRERQVRAKARMAAGRGTAADGVARWQIAGCR